MCMTVAELIKALEAMPDDLEVLVCDAHSYELDEIAIDYGRRLPEGVPWEGLHDWRWERDNPQPDNNDPNDRFTQRIAIIY